MVFYRRWALVIFTSRRSRAVQGEVVIKLFRLVAAGYLWHPGRLSWSSASQLARVIFFVSAFYLVLLSNHLLQARRFFFLFVGGGGVQKVIFSRLSASRLKSHALGTNEK